MSWEAVEGASYYQVYYSNIHRSDCSLGSDGNPKYCQLLAGEVATTTYTHSDLGANTNYYWVVACNSNGCSEIDSDHPAEAWSAEDFLARHHVVDGGVAFSVKVDPDCTSECDRSIYPGTGSGDFETFKAVTGVDLGLRNPGDGRYMDRVRNGIADGRITNARVVLTNEDIEKAHEDGDYAIMFYLQKREDPDWRIEGDVAALREWYARGLTVLMLAYGSNDHGPAERLGYGHREGEEKGVTELGRAAIAEMNELGMIVDVSHSSRQTTLDAAALSTKPIIASHANSEALTPHSRNKEDEELIAIAASGGVVGITTIRWMLDTDGDGSAGMDDMISHIEYTVKLIGIDHVGVATDAWADGWDVTSGHYADADLAVLDRWRRLASRLYARGWTEEDLAKLLGGNFRRVFAEVLPAR